jgi:hypothetical protein
LRKWIAKWPVRDRRHSSETTKEVSIVVEEADEVSPIRNLDNITTLVDINEVCKCSHLQSSSFPKRNP